MKHILYLIINILLLSSLHATNNVWDWPTINTEDIYFPPQFLWGTATSAHQVEGNCINNWSIWENKQTHNNKSTIKHNTCSGIACDHWNLYQEDIKLMQELGVNSYRFSVEWSKIEPEEGVINEAALTHYRTVCEALHAAGITPNITLHHFTHPVWFEEKGAFEKEENIVFFVRFCKLVFSKLSDVVPLWCTLNEPNTFAFQGYCTGMFTPGVNDPQRALTVLKNMMEAHVQVYHTLKNLPDGPKALIGLAHNITQFDAYRWWDPVARAFCAIAGQCFNTLVLEFLQNGSFVYTLPGLVKIYHTNKKAVGALDFIGLNYYSHLVIDSQINLNEPFKPRYKAHEVMTDLPYPLYPEGFYDAIQQVAKLKVPIYITENGIADCSDDRRAFFIKRYLYVLSQALKDGYDIRGYYYWSLLDNFEWCEGYDPKFGLYQVDFKTQKRTLRAGAYALTAVIKRFAPQG